MKSGTLRAIATSLVLLAACAAEETPRRSDAAVVLEAANANAPMLGPAAAKGAIIYNHGLDYEEDSSGEPPFFLDAARAHGWDVFTLLRPLVDDRADHSDAILAGKAVQLREQGYRRIVSVGQSFGAWISIEVAARPGTFDAIIGMSPAEYGSFAPARDRNAEIVDIAAKMAPTPTMIVLFKGDDFDPGGRGPAFARVLAAKGIPYAVIDRPPGFEGHTAGMGESFAAYYGSCILAFIDTPQPPGAFACAPHQPSLAEVAARLPKAKTFVSKTISIDSPYIGHWYGWYIGGGRETLLTIEKVSTIDRAEGSYTFGPAAHDETGGSYLVDGPIDAEGLHLKTPHSTLVYKLQADGTLAGHWSAMGGSGDVILHRLD
ncbi:MAG TPA: hypothetical protein VGG27_03280 [Magnetospirillaceae bacterium]|jgi:dienelactone hydrolase